MKINRFFVLTTLSFIFTFPLLVLAQNSPLKTIETVKEVGSLPVPSVSPAMIKEIIAISPEQKTKLLSEFKKALNNEEKSVQHQDRSEMKEFNAAQSLKIKNWREHERSVRKSFFESHQSGPDRRKFVQDYIKRKEQFDLANKNDQIASKKASKEKLENLKKQQAERLIQFQKQLEENHTPDVSLWPQNH